ncbi:14 kDa zinc-binding protein, partial [Phtheirospermum japonicum]
TARKPNRGKAPRKQLATRAARKSTPTTHRGSSWRLGRRGNLLRRMEASRSPIASSQGQFTPFTKILNKQISANIVYEDDKAEVRHCEILGHLLYTAKLVAKQ